MTAESQGRVVIAQHFDARHFDAVIVQGQRFIENRRDRGPDSSSAFSAETQGLRRKVGNPRYFAVCGYQVLLSFRGKIFVLQKKKKIRDRRQRIVDAMRNAGNEAPRNRQLLRSSHDLFSALLARDISRNL